MSDDRQGKIEQRAHEIWQREGCPEGRADEHWRLATAEIEAEEAAAASRASAAPKPDPHPEPGPAAKEIAKAAANAQKTTPSSKPRSTIAKAETAKADEPKKTARKKK